MAEHEVTLMLERNSLGCPFRDIGVLLRQVGEVLVTAKYLIAG